MQQRIWGILNGILVLLDHLIGTRKERLRDREAERPGGLEIDDEIVLARLLHWQVARLLASEDAIDVSRGVAVLIENLRRVAHQAAGGDKQPVWVDGRQSMLRGHRTGSVPQNQ